MYISYDTIFYFDRHFLFLFFFSNMHTNSDMYGTLNSATTGDVVKTRP